MSTQRTEQQLDPRETPSWAAGIPQAEILLQAVEQSPDGVAVIHVDGTILYVNPAWSRLHGYTREEMVGRHIREFYPEGLDDQDVIALVAELAQAERQETEIRYLRRDGSVGYAWLIITLLHDPSGRPQGFVVTVRDVSERVAMAQALEQEKARLERQSRRNEALAQIQLAISHPNELRDVLQSVAQAITEHLPASGGASIILWDAARQDFVLGASTVPGQDVELPARRVRRRQGVTRWIVEHRQPYLCPDVLQDTRFPLNPIVLEYNIRAFVGVPILGEQGCLGILYALDRQPRTYSEDDVAFLRELADRAALAVQKATIYEELRRTNEALQRQTAELEARNQDLDAFSRMVAHDLKNLLSVILGYSEILYEDLPHMTPEEAREHVAIVLERARIMQRVIEDLLLLARIRLEDLPLEPVDMGRVVEAAWTRLQEMARAAGAVRLDSPTDWPWVLGHAGWLEEVWVNYLSNAIKYGGEPPQIRLGYTLVDERRVRCWVEDNGPGIPPAFQERLFLPFERLRRINRRGHGLGLSIVRMIVEKCGGTVGVDTAPGRGSRFWFELPVASPPDESPTDEHGGKDGDG